MQVGKPIGELDIDLVNWREGFVVLTDGRTVPIVNWFDENGEETLDRMEAVSFVAGPAHAKNAKGRKLQKWFSGRVRDYKPVKLS